MTKTQITIRVAADVVADADAAVEAGLASSRADYFEKAAIWERRRAAARRDAMIYAEHGEDPEIEAFLKHARGRYPKLDD